TRFHLIIVIGPEKVTASLDDALVMLEAWSQFGEGSPLPDQSIIVHSPSEPAQPSEPFRELNGSHAQSATGNVASIHVIILDNGRCSLQATRVASALDCIDCGACQTFCPVHLEVGDAFGGK